MLCLINRTIIVDTRWFRLDVGLDGLWFCWGSFADRLFRRPFQLVIGGRREK